MTPLLGLVLAGGRSTRMHLDKASLTYGARPQLAVAYDLVARHVERAFVSVRPDQAAEPLRSRFPQVVDGAEGRGPIAGIIAAQARHPDAAWLVVACDLPYLDDATLDALVRGRDARRLATAFRSSHDALPEPLCAIYEPSSRGAILAQVSAGRDCPRKFLLSHDVLLLEPLRPDALDNANTPADAEAARTALSSAGAA